MAEGTNWNQAIAAGLGIAQEFAKARGSEDWDKALGAGIDIASGDADDKQAAIAGLAGDVIAAGGGPKTTLRDIVRPSDFRRAGRPAPTSGRMDLFDQAARTSRRTAAQPSPQKGRVGMLGLIAMAALALLGSR